MTRIPSRADLPLHAEVYLLAHDDDTGRPHLNEQSLAIGLAGAVLLELVEAGHLVVGWVYDDFTARWRRRPGQLYMCRPGPAGSPLLDAALAAATRVVRAQPRGDHLRTFLHSFAANDLYERVRAAMITAGLIRHTRLRRLVGLRKIDTYLPVEVAYPTRVRARVRDAVAFHEPGQYRPLGPPDTTGVALCGLIAVLELTPFLYRAEPDRELAGMLRLVVDRYPDPTVAATVRAVVQAVDAGRGDVAVAAMG
jgi:hypothetical protein